MIFMGNGDLSYVKCYLLHRKVEEAIEMLGGLQQPPRATDPVSSQREREYRIGKRKLIRIIEDIANDLGYNEFKDDK